jgi:hypothetical protein
MNDEVIGIITEKHGGVNERLLSLAHNLRENYKGVSVTEPSFYTDNQINFSHPNAILAELINIMYKYTNIE